MNKGVRANGVRAICVRANGVRAKDVKAKDVKFKDVRAISGKIIYQNCSFSLKNGQKGPLIRYTGHVRLVGLRLGLFYFVRLSLLSFGPKGQNYVNLT